MNPLPLKLSNLFKTEWNTLHLSLSGSHSSFFFFSPCRYRITIGNKTCVFERENDPSLLRSPSAGKLIQYTVEDGGHVFAGQCYAEIEVQYLICTKKTKDTSFFSFFRSCLHVNFVLFLCPGDEDGNDSYSCRIRLYSLREAGRSCTGAWVCHCQAAAG